MKKRILPLLLALLMCCMAFAACGDKDGDEGNTPPPSAVGPSDSGYVLPLKNLAMDDGSKREMTVLYSEGQTKQMIEDTANADRVNQGIIERNALVEEQLFCAIEYKPMSMSAESLNQALTEEMMSQSGEYDVIFYPYWFGVEPKGYFYNLLSSPIISEAIDEEFYCQGWNNATTFRNTLNSLTGYGTLDMMTNTTVTIFNKDLYNNLFDFDLYDYVDAGAFTLETMGAMAKAANYDFDGDGMDARDRFGVVYHLWAGRAMLFTMGGIVTTWNADGEPTIQYTTDLNLQVMDAMKNFMEVDYTYFDRASVTDYFADEKCLFAMGTFETASDIRKKDTGIDYGFVPYPKLNDEQKNYISTNTGMGTWSIPKTVESFENSAYFLNAFHYFSNQEIRNEYFEDVLKYGIAQDPESAKTVDDIMSSIYMDFAFIYDVNISTGVYNSKGQTVSLTNGAFEVVRGNVAMDFVSFYQSNDSALRANIENFMNTYVTPENDY